MANATHVRLAATAKRLIEKHGRTVTFVKNSTTLTDSAKPWDGVAPASPTETSAVAAVFEDTTFDAAGTSVHRKNVGMVLVAQNSLGTAVDLSTYDVVNDGGKPRKITRRLKIAPGDTTVAWMLEVEL